VASVKEENFGRKNPVPVIDAWRRDRRQPAAAKISSSGQTNTLIKTTAWEGSAPSRKFHGRRRLARTPTPSIEQGRIGTDPFSQPIERRAKSSREPPGGNEIQNQERLAEAKLGIL